MASTGAPVLFQMPITIFVHCVCCANDTLLRQMRQNNVYYVLTYAIALFFFSKNDDIVDYDVAMTYLVEVSLEHNETSFSDEAIKIYQEYQRQRGGDAAAVTEGESPSPTDMANVALQHMFGNDYNQVTFGRFLHGLYIISTSYSVNVVNLMHYERVVVDEKTNRVSLPWDELVLLMQWISVDCALLGGTPLGGSSEANNQLFNEFSLSPPVDWVKKVKERMVDGMEAGKSAVARSVKKIIFDDSGNIVLRDARTDVSAELYLKTFREANSFVLTLFVRMIGMVMLRYGDMSDKMVVPCFASQPRVNHRTVVSMARILKDQGGNQRSSTSEENLGILDGLHSVKGGGTYGLDSVSVMPYHQSSESQREGDQGDNPILPFVDISGTSMQPSNLQAATTSGWQQYILAFALLFDVNLEQALDFDPAQHGEPVSGLLVHTKLIELLSSIFDYMSPETRDYNTIHFFSFLLHRYNNQITEGFPFQWNNLSVYDYYLWIKILFAQLTKGVRHGMVDGMGRILSATHGLLGTTPPFSSGNWLGHKKLHWTSAELQIQRLFTNVTVDAIVPVIALPPTISGRNASVWILVNELQSKVIKYAELTQQAKSESVRRSLQECLLNLLEQFQNLNQQELLELFDSVPALIARGVAAAEDAAKYRFDRLKTKVIELMEKCPKGEEFNAAMRSFQAGNARIYHDKHHSLYSQPKAHKEAWLVMSIMWNIHTFHDAKDLKEMFRKMKFVLTYSASQKNSKVTGRDPEDTMWHSYTTHQMVSGHMKFDADTGKMMPSGDFAADPIFSVSYTCMTRLRKRVFGIFVLVCGCKAHG